MKENALLSRQSFLCVQHFVWYAKISWRTNIIFCMYNYVLYGFLICWLQFMIILRYILDNFETSITKMLPESVGYKFFLLQSYRCYEKPHKLPSIYSACGKVSLIKWSSNAAAEERVFASQLWRDVLQEIQLHWNAYNDSGCASAVEKFQNTKQLTVAFSCHAHCWGASHVMH